MGRKRNLEDFLPLWFANAGNRGRKRQLEWLGGNCEESQELCERNDLMLGEWTILACLGEWGSAGSGDVTSLTRSSTMVLRVLRWGQYLASVQNVPRPGEHSSLFYFIFSSVSL